MSALIDGAPPSDASFMWQYLAGDDGERHVLPTFGRKHALSRACWCHPVDVGTDDERADVVTHQVAQ